MGKIALIYRALSTTRFSIETVFKPLNAHENINPVVLPHNLTSVSNLWRLIWFSFKIRESNIHITGDVNFMAIFMFWKKIIITVHDLNHYEDLRGWRKVIYGAIWFYLPLKIARKVVVISPYTKLQLEKYFHIPATKIEVVPNSFQLFETRKLSFAKMTPLRILCIGNKENKNIDRLIDSIYKPTLFTIKFIGKQPGHIIDKLNFKAISFDTVSNISTKQLANEYINADVLYFASTKEGFGLPILEAQSVGLPVITSDTTSMPFVAGDGAILVNPFDLDEIRNALEYCAENDLSDIINKGFNNTLRFSKQQFVNSYLTLYKQTFKV